MEVEREPAKLFAKLLPVLEHHICTSFGISKEYYGSSIYKLGRTRQGNSVLEVICRDTSYIIFKKLENENLGVTVKLLLSNKELMRSVIVFVDNTNFYSNDKDYMIKM